MKPKWDDNCTYNEMNFLETTLRFHNMAIQDALGSEDYLIKIFAVWGLRTLRRIATDEKHKMYPEWVRQFCELRLSQK